MHNRFSPRTEPLPTPARTQTTRRRRLAFAAGAVAIVVLLAGCYTSNQGKMVDLVNGSRRSAGLSSVRANQAAMDKAQGWAAHMARTGVVEHSAGGSRMSTAGLPRWCAAAENVAKATSIQHAHDLFMASPGHKANIVGPYNRIGTGVVRKGSYVYAVQVFYRAC